MESDQRSNETGTSKWEWFGYKFPRREVVYFSQIIILYMVILACLFNLSFGNGDSNLWTALLSSAIGILLPNPRIDHHHGSHVRDPA